jgi:hypothetical protein
MLPQGFDGSRELHGAPLDHGRGMNGRCDEAMRQ